MPRITNFALTLALIFCSTIFCHAQEQTPSIEVTTDSHRAQFAVSGEGQAVHVEVYAPSGEMVFDSGTVTGQVVEWRIQNQKGEPVADGIYLATISTKSSTGQARKRIEQIVVSREPQTNDQAVAPSAPEAAITGAGTGTATSGTIAKFTGASTIGNSVIVQSATKNIGIGTTAPPTAKLQVNAAQPPPLAGNGTSAATLLQTSGGKGGNTTGAAAGFQNAGAGASISLLAGNGGNAPAGSRRGNGGSITLQPGSTGTGAGLAGVSGNVLIDPSGVGNVGIGTLSPTSKLTVRTADNNYGLVHTDGTVTVGSFVNVVAGWYGTQSNHPLYFFTNDSAAKMTIATSGNVGIGTTVPSARLTVRGPGTTSGDLAFRVDDSAGVPKFVVYSNGYVNVGKLVDSNSTGHICRSGGYLSTCGSAAEYVPTIDGGSGFAQTADLVSIAPSVKNPYDDEHSPFVVTKSAKPCDDNLLGFIVDPKSGADGKKLNEHYLPLAIYGYFPAKVTTENGAIKRGDPITSSSKPGYGMKATDACKIVGYALEDADRERKIQVFSQRGEYSVPQVKALRAQVEQLQREKETEVEALKSENTAIKGRLEVLERAVTVSATNRPQ